jgi:hypothetical protein
MAQHQYATSSVMAFSIHHQQQYFPFSNVKIPPYKFLKHISKWSLFKENRCYEQYNTPVTVSEVGWGNLNLVGHVAKMEKIVKEHSIFSRKSLEKLSPRRWWEGTIVMHQRKMGCKDWIRQDQRFRSLVTENTVWHYILQTK